MQLFQDFHISSIFANFLPSLVILTVKGDVCLHHQLPQCICLCSRHHAGVNMFSDMPRKNNNYIGKAVIVQIWDFLAMRFSSGEDGSLLCCTAYRHKHYPLRKQSIIASDEHEKLTLRSKWGKCHTGRQNMFKILTGSHTKLLFVLSNVKQDKPLSFLLIITLIHKYKRIILGCLCIPLWLVILLLHVPPFLLCIKLVVRSDFFFFAMSKVPLLLP